MNNFKKLLTINKKKALSIAVATAVAASSLTGCSNNKTINPITGEEEDEEDNGFFSGSGNFFRFGGRSNSLRGNSNITSTPNTGSNSTINNGTSSNSSTKSNPSKGKSGYSSSKGGSSSS